MSGFFRTADDRWLCVVPRGPSCFPSFLTAMGHGDLIGQPRYAVPITDLDVVRELRAMFDAAFASMTLEEAAEKLNAVDLIWAPMSRLGDVTADVQAEAAGCFVDTPDNWGGAFRATATPIRFPETPIAPRGPAPWLGQHTREVLIEAGYAPEAVDALLASGAAGQGSAPIKP